MTHHCFWSILSAVIIVGAHYVSTEEVKKQQPSELSLRRWGGQTHQDVRDMVNGGGGVSIFKQCVKRIIWVLILYLKNVSINKCLSNPCPCLKNWVIGLFMTYVLKGLFQPLCWIVCTQNTNHFWKCKKKTFLKILFKGPSLGNQRSRVPGLAPTVHPWPGLDSGPDIGPKNQILPEPQCPHLWTEILGPN